MKNKKIIKYVAFIVGGLILGAILLGVLNGLVGKGEWNLGWTNYRYDDSAYHTGEGTIPAPALEKIELDEIKPSNRKYPYINFEMDREPGKEILFVEGLTKKAEDGKKLLNNISINVMQGDKIAFVGPMGAAKTELFEILTDNSAQEEGSYKFGITTSVAYFPKDNSREFMQDISLTDCFRMK